MNTIQLVLALLCGIIMREGHAWWPGYAGYPPPYYPPYPPYPGSPCGGPPCEEGTPKPPCPTRDPFPPNTTCQCPAAKACSVVLTPDHAMVDVPCGYGIQLIDDFTVKVLNDTCGPQNYRFELALLHGGLVDGATGNFMTEPYVLFDHDTGHIYFDHSLVPDAFTTSGSLFQSIAIKAYGLQNSIVSQTVFITFTFRYFMLNLTGPIDTQMICPGRPPGRDPNRKYYTYPQIAVTVNNIPPGMPLAWDLPSDRGGRGASTDALDAMGDRIYFSITQLGNLP